MLSRSKVLQETVQQNLPEGTVGKFRDDSRIWEYVKRKLRSLVQPRMLDKPQLLFAVLLSKCRLAYCLFCEVPAVNFRSTQSSNSAALM